MPIASSRFARRSQEFEVILSQIVKTVGRVEARETATRIRETVNLANLGENILRIRQRAELLLRKSPDQLIKSVHLRKL